MVAGRDGTIILSAAKDDAMPLTRNFRDTVRARAEREPAFRRALFQEAVQALLRAWSDSSEKRNVAQMLDHAALPWFAELNRSLTDTLDDAQFSERIHASVALLRQLALEIHARALACDPALDDRDLKALLAQHWPSNAAADCSMLFDTVSGRSAEPA